jgi:hypothetical protein
VACENARREMKMNKKIIWGLASLFLLAGCATFESAEVREQRYGKAAPVIDQYFASPSMRQGDTWKVYLRASDPDGDMKRIVTYLGPGSRAADSSAAFTRLREEDRREFSGYLYWFPGSDVGYSGPYVMIIQVEDQAGHYSAPISLTLNIQPSGRQESPPAGVFQEKEIGAVLISIKRRANGDGGGM